MCGICGQYNFDQTQASESVLKKMMKRMKHRGPDDEGIFIDKNSGFGFVRLSIIDLSFAGHQPMQDETGRFTIVFNGEIYNYIELREKLKSEGFSFFTKTDTEVFLKSYIAWGETCLNHLNGMFAFVIYDNFDKIVFGGRDRFGVKPFYYTKNDNYFRFASEIASLCETSDKKSNADEQSIFEYLVFNRTDQTENTFFEDIKKLQHGHCFTIKNSNFIIKKWYDLKSNVKEAKFSPKDYKDLLSSSIGLRLRSDVPIGVCLSGGLDSSSITSLLISDFGKNDINTFSAVYNNGQTGDESGFIDEYKDLLNNMYFITPTADSLFSDLDMFIQAHSEPVPSASPYAQFKVMQLAKGKVVVTLDGQGADEQLAGYHYFYGLFFKELLLKADLKQLSKELIEYWKAHQSFFGYKTLFFFLLPNWLRTKAKVFERGYLYDDFINKYNSKNTISDNLYAAKSLNDALFDHFEYKLEHLLKWSDTNSMWFSIESRAPFLDYRLVEKTLSSPNFIKIKDGITKHILRESMIGILPEKIRTRKDKIGFSTPDNEWFRTEIFNNLISGILNSDSFKDRHIIDPSKAITLYNKHLKNEINISKDIWKWINLELWFRKYID